MCAGDIRLWPSLTVEFSVSSWVSGVGDSSSFVCLFLSLPWLGDLYLLIDLSAQLFFFI